MSIEIYFYKRCRGVGLTKEGTCSLMSMVKGESNFNPYNLEDKYNKSLGMTDEQYVARVDNGTYTEFVSDHAGFGLAQHTFPDRKRDMLGFSKQYGGSIGDYKMQTDFILWELYNKYRSIWNKLITSHDLQELTWLLIDEWERPADKNDAMRVRYVYALGYYNVVKDADDSALFDEPKKEEDDGTRGVIEKYTQAAVMIADDNSHGYSQANRWGPDYDCSSLVITVVQYAGVPVKDRGATYTGNMRKVFLASGFTDVTRQCNLGNGNGMQYGDILLNDVNHAAIYLGEGRIVHARSSEGNSLQGDQSGNEIRTQQYYNYPWNIVMRYTGGKVLNTPTTSLNGDVSAHDSNVVLLRKGSKGANVKVLQEKLIQLGYDVGPDGADGDFGDNTAKALMQFQQEHDLEVDGVFGPLTFEVMKNAGKTASTSAAVQSKPAQESTAGGVKVKVGTVVKFTGDRCYKTSNGDAYKTCKPGKARVTVIKPAAKHPYYLIRLLLGGSTVYGWVDADAIEVK